MNLPTLVANPIGPEADPFGVGTVRIVVVIGLIILIIFGYVRRRTSVGREIKKKYRDSIISGIIGGLGAMTGLYLIRGEFSWEYLIWYPIGFALAHLIGHLLRDRRGEKKEEDVQPRG